MVAHFTRMCADDRPGVRLNGPDRSTPVPQPHPVDQAADDLRRVLAAGPLCLAAHSYGGLVATQLARTWPTAVWASSWSILVSRSCARWRARRLGQVERIQPEDDAPVPGGCHASRCVRQARRGCSAARTAGCGGAPTRPISAPKKTDPAYGIAVADWQASEKLLARSLDAKFIAKTNSGHLLSQPPRSIIT